MHTWCSIQSLVTDNILVIYQYQLQVFTWKILTGLDQLLVTLGNKAIYQILKNIFSCVGTQKLHLSKFDLWLPIILQLPILGTHFDINPFPSVSTISLDLTTS